LAVFGLAACSNIAALGLGVTLVPMLSREVEFGVMFFLLAASALGLLTLLLVLIPSWYFFKRTKGRRHRLSLRLSCLTLIMLLIEFVVLLRFGH
jgi:hypothetical protein